MRLKDLPRPIGIVGLGVSGKSALRLLNFAGIKDIPILDNKSGAADFDNSEDFIKTVQPKTLVVSPGVPLRQDWIYTFSKQGGLITSELALAFSELNQERRIGITGSAGKSTTVSLLAYALKSYTDNFFVGGNLGVPLSDYIYDVLSGNRKRADSLVLELSSFQLENFSNMQFDFSAITSFVPNHLERYSSLEDYYLTKWSLVEKTKGLCFLNSSCSSLIAFSEKQGPPKNVVYVNKNSESLKKFSLKNSALIGEHNQDNLALAANIALSAGWPESCLQAMKEFKGLEHRLENFMTKRGVIYINDSKATTVESVLQAVSAVKNKYGSKKILLLLGGKDKNLPWQDLSILKSDASIRLCFFGESAEKALSLSRLPGPRYNKLYQLLLDLPTLINDSEIVLFSPGGTSLDEFPNFEARGKFFKDEIAKY